MTRARRIRSPACAPTIPGELSRGRIRMQIGTGPPARRWSSRPRPARPRRTRSRRPGRGAEVIGSALLYPNQASDRCCRRSRTAGAGRQGLASGPGSRCRYTRVHLRRSLRAGGGGGRLPCHRAARRTASRAFAQRTCRGRRRAHPARVAAAAPAACDSRPDRALLPRPRRRSRWSSAPLAADPLDPQLRPVGVARLGPRDHPPQPADHGRPDLEAAARDLHHALRAVRQGRSRTCGWWSHGPGAFAAVVMVFRLSFRLTRSSAATSPRREAADRVLGPAPALLAGRIAALGLALSGGFLSDNALGYSEGLATARS